MKIVCFALTRTLIAVVLLVPGTGDAAVIAAWDLTDEPGDQVSTRGDGSPNVSAADMIRGPGLGLNTTLNSLNSNGWGDTQAAIPADDSEYIEFGFDVTPGFQVVFGELFLGTRSSNTGPGTLGLYTSADNFASPVTTIVQPGLNVLNSAIDLSSLSPLTGSFRVRLIEIGNTQADGGGTTANGGTFRVANHSDDVVSLHGTTQPIVVLSSIPEPSTALVFATLGVLVLGVTGFRRMPR